MKKYFIEKRDRSTDDWEIWMSSSDDHTRDHMIAMAHRMSARNAKFEYRFEERESI